MNHPSQQVTLASPKLSQVEPAQVLKMSQVGSASMGTIKDKKAGLLLTFHFQPGAWKRSEGTSFFLEQSGS